MDTLRAHGGFCSPGHAEQFRAHQSEDRLRRPQEVESGAGARPASEEGACQWCGAPLPLLMRLRGARFCSAAHEEAFTRRQAENFLERVKRYRRQGGGSRLRSETTKITIRPGTSKQTGKIPRDPLPQPRSGNHWVEMWPLRLERILERVPRHWKALPRTENCKPLLARRAMGGFLRIKAAGWLAVEESPLQPGAGTISSAPARPPRNTVALAAVRDYHAGHGAAIMQEASQPEPWPANDGPRARISGGTGSAPAGRQGGAVPPAPFLPPRLFLAQVSLWAPPPAGWHPPEVAWLFRPSPSRWSWSGRVGRIADGVFGMEARTGERRSRPEFSRPVAWTDTVTANLPTMQRMPAAICGVRGLRAGTQSRFPAGVPPATWRAANPPAMTHSSSSPRLHDAEWLLPLAPPPWERLPLRPWPGTALPSRHALAQATAPPAGVRPMPAPTLAAPQPPGLLLPETGPLPPGAVSRFLSSAVLSRCNRTTWRPVRVDVFRRRQAQRAGAAPGPLPAWIWRGISGGGPAAVRSVRPWRTPAKPTRLVILLETRRLQAEGPAAPHLPGTPGGAWSEPGGTIAVLPLRPGTLEVRWQGWFWPETSFLSLWCRRAAQAGGGAGNPDFLWVPGPALPGVLPSIHAAAPGRFPLVIPALRRSGSEPVEMPEACWEMSSPHCSTRFPQATATTPRGRVGGSYLLFAAGTVLTGSAWQGAGRGHWSGLSPAAPAWQRLWRPGPPPCWTRDVMKKSVPDIFRVQTRPGGAYMDRMRLPLLVCRFPHAMASEMTGSSGAETPLFPMKRI